MLFDLFSGGWYLSILSLLMLLPDGGGGAGVLDEPPIRQLSGADMLMHLLI